MNDSLKLIGICFGHQIIARAYGAKTEKNEKGWEVGTRDIELTHTAKQLFTRVKLVSLLRLNFILLYNSATDDLGATSANSSLASHSPFTKCIKIMFRSFLKALSPLDPPRSVQYMAWSSLSILKVPSRSRTSQSSLCKVRAYSSRMFYLSVDLQILLTGSTPSTGHPEYNAKIVNEVIAIRLQKGVFSQEFADQSYEDAAQHDDGLLLGWKMLEILGI